MEVPAEIRERYIRRRKRDLEVCFSSLEANNFEELVKIGHQLKGNGSTFGHPQLSEIGKKLEAGACLKDHQEVEETLKELSLWLHNQLN